MLEVEPALLERRRRLGLDRWDEMWEGVLHMAPAPANEHQRMVDELLFFLMGLLRRTGRGTIRSSINVFDEESPLENYRIPDLTFVAAGCERLFAEDGIRGGGPDAVIEVRSPGDESYEKLPFFAKLGVREVLIIDRDSKRVDAFRLKSGQHVREEAGPGGDVASEALGVRFRTLPAEPQHLFVSDTRSDDLRAEI